MLRSNWGKCYTCARPLIVRLADFRNAYALAQVLLFAFVPEVLFVLQVRDLQSLPDQDPTVSNALTVPPSVAVRGRIVFQTVSLQA